MTMLPITTLYALPLTVIYLALFMNVTMARSNLSQSIGDGGNVDLHERIRKHGNFVECVPMVMVLMILAEAQGAGAIVLHALGLKANAPTHPLRIAGNSGAMLATAILFIVLARRVTGL
jgi:uncharacterized protein